MDKPGINEETFKIILDNNYNVDTLLKDHVEQRRLIVTSEPKHIYGKWYHKLLNKLTLGNRFCEAWEHEVKSEPVTIKIGLNGK